MIAEDDELCCHTSYFQAEIRLQTMDRRIKEILCGGVLIVVYIQLVHDILFYNDISLAHSAQCYSHVFHKLPVIGIRERYFQLILHILQQLLQIQDIKVVIHFQKVVIKLFRNAVIHSLRHLLTAIDFIHELLIILQNRLPDIELSACYTDSHIALLYDFQIKFQ